MTKREVLNAFREIAAPGLRDAGFVGRQGHFLRRAGAVTQVVELQHSIYGGRVTVNLGLGLEWMQTQLPWVQAPALGPHAHDCTRWIRLGLVSPARADTWWSFTDDEDSSEEAVGALSRVLLEHGVGWFDAESSEQAFLRYATDKLERSKSRRHPKGCFAELRLIAAVCAWSEDPASARRYAKQAKKLWEEERGRLQQARALYARRHPERGAALAPVPDLGAELERLTSTTKASSVFSAEAAARTRRSKSSSSEPSRAE